MNTRHAAVAGMVALLVSGCASPPEQAAPSPVASPMPAPSGSRLPAESALPAGWRWESFGGVEVGVPGDWGWDNGSQWLRQWCVGRTDRSPAPVVGRPGPSTLVGCPLEAGQFEVGTTGTVVAFEWTDQRDGIEQRGDRTTVRRNGVEVTVQAEADLRRRILATIRTVRVDHHGCPADHPIADRPGRRPAQPVDLAELGDVSTVAACRYQVRWHTGLLSSLRLNGPAATAAVRELAAAPRGGGPDEPETYTPDVSYGDEVLLLLIDRRREVVVRYSGCDHNGIDDGTGVRRLTRAAVAPLVAGPNRVWSFCGGDEKLRAFGY